MLEVSETGDDSIFANRNTHDAVVTILDSGFDVFFYSYLSDLVLRTQGGLVEGGECVECT